MKCFTVSVEPETESVELESAVMGEPASLDSTVTLAVGHSVNESFSSFFRHSEQ